MMEKLVIWLNTCWELIALLRPRFCSQAARTVWDSEMFLDHGWKEPPVWAVSGKAALAGTWCDVLLLNFLLENGINEGTTLELLLCNPRTGTNLFSGCSTRSMATINGQKVCCVVFLITTWQFLVSCSCMRNKPLQDMLVYTNHPGSCSSTRNKC